MAKEYKRKVFLEYSKLMIDDSDYETENLELWQKLDEE